MNDDHLPVRPVEATEEKSGPDHDRAAPDEC
jgi:hypothetical protein